MSTTIQDTSHDEPIELVIETVEIASDDAAIAQLSDEMEAARIALAEIQRRYDEAVNDSTL
jgi:hypothetical protein